MKSKTLRTVAAALAVAGALSFTAAAHAHRAWLLPSSTVLSGQNPWVAVDAAISNDLFVFEYMPGNLAQLVVVAPDGSRAKAENAAQGRYRSSFDLQLTQRGTYRVALVSEGLMASFKVGTETRRLRGSKAELAAQIPAGAQQLSVVQVSNRVETFVTAGNPSTANLKPSGRGIELVPVTHPNDLVAGETATFRFVDGGQPAAGYTATLILGGKRYRSELGEQTLKTDADGQLQLSFPAAGMYWLNVAPPRPDGPPQGGSLEQPLQRSGYSLTLEVLPG